MAEEDGARFCQAESAIFYRGDAWSWVATPEEGINMVRVEADGWGCVPESMWRLRDPLNEGGAYLAKFARADVADRTADGGFALTATGALWHLPSGGDDGNAEPEKIESGRAARIILSGSQGRCRGVCAFVAYEDDAA